MAFPHQADLEQGSLELEDLWMNLTLNTGMGRIGLRTKDELIQIINELKTEDAVELDGMFTHFATADDLNPDYFLKPGSDLDEIQCIIHWTLIQNRHGGAKTAPPTLKMKVEFGTLTGGTSFNLVSYSYKIRNIDEESYLGAMGCALKLAGHPS